MRVPWAKKPSDTQKSYVMITLTPLGIKKAESFESEGDDFEILSSLTQDRPQSVGGLAKNTNMPFDKCLKHCKELKMKGYIQQVQRSE